MASVNLGKIKLKWRGTWSSGGSYTADDVVEYTDGSVTSSYIAVASSSNQTPSSGGTVNSSYWNYAAKGQSASPTTTQGDIIVRGASADERLGIGAAGKVLKVNSSANGYEFGDGGKIVNIATVRHTTSTSFNVGSTNLDGANLFYYPNTANAMMELDYSRQRSDTAVILTGHYCVDSSTNMHAMWAFLEGTGIRKNLGFDEHNYKREYQTTSFFCMFLSSELTSIGTNQKRYVVGGGAGNNRTHTGARCPNTHGSFGDTSNTATYSELTLIEVLV